MIWKLIRRNVAGKPFRFLLTCSAVTVGVMFTVGVFVFTDAQRSQFAALAEDIEGGTDYAVRTSIEFGDDTLRPPFDLAVSDQIAAVPGVTNVQPYVLKFDVIPRIDDERLIASFGVNIGLNWPTDSATPRLFISDGEPPATGTEFAIDSRAAEDFGFELGGTYTIDTPTGPGDFVLVGIFHFADPEVSQLFGDTIQVAFDTETAVEVLNGGVGIDRVEFSTTADLTDDELFAALEPILPPTLEIVTGEQLVEEQESDFGEFVDIFRTVLLAFAIIILAVSAFVIFNVFTILIGQRVRELGLLRAIGASGNQVTKALLGEALLVGVASTAMGIVLGIGFGWFMGWLLGTLQFGPSTSELIITRTALIWGVAVGVIVTMASAIVPALRARHLTPMMALREDGRLRQIVPVRNLAIGVPLVIGAWALYVIGIAIGGDSDWPVWIVIPLFGFGAAFANAYGLRRIDAAAGRFAMLGFGAISIVLTVVLDLDVGELLLLLAVAAVTLFLGVNAISPRLARPVSHFLGRWPLAILLLLGGIALTLAGVGALVGAAVLLVQLLADVFGSGDATAMGALAVVLLGLFGALIARVGYRTVDASLIMGWSWPAGLGGVIVFGIGAIGVISLVTGVIGVLTFDFGAATITSLLVGAVATVLAAVARRKLPTTMKANARMARENAGRSPQRTASAAAALMIGLALVTTAAVVTDSFKATFADVLEERVISDFFISHENFAPNTSFSRELAGDLNDVAEVESAISFRFAFEAFRFSVDGSTRDASAVELETSLDHFDPGFLDLDPSLVGPGSIWIHEDVAADTELSVGDALGITFNDGSIEQVRVAAIYEDLSIYGSAVVDLSLWESHFPTANDQFVSLLVADGVDTEDARAAIEAVAVDYPVNVDTRDEFQERQEGIIDQFLQTFTVLLLAAILVAVLGISITLALSVFERTRELGLVRAVGMTRRQMMRMVLFEGAIIAAFGGFLGVVLGTVFGAAAVTVIPDTFISSVSIPVGTLAAYLALASIAGIAAAIIPARRAARLNVLEAISQG
ncbi:MAG: FtsX-like permease family protein [Acidimicrobiales bacterium]|nr:FtsX-like permease family protein [Acidimicrobiales bacterium]